MYFFKSNNPFFLFKNKVTAESKFTQHQFKTLLECYSSVIFLIKSY